MAFAAVGDVRLYYAIVGGFSMGGSIALNVALRHPDRVQALVLAGTGTGSADKRQFTLDFGPLAERLEREGAAAAADDYLTGPTRIQLLRPRPEAWRKLRDSGPDHHRRVPRGPRSPAAAGPVAVTDGWRCGAPAVLAKTP